MEKAATWSLWLDRSKPTKRRKSICSSGEILSRKWGLIRACRENDFERAREIHFQLLPLFEALFCETNPIPVKCALELMGQIESAEVRLPLTPITDANRERLQVVLKELGQL